MHVPEERPRVRSKSHPRSTRRQAPDPTHGPIDLPVPLDALCRFWREIHAGPQSLPS